MVIFLIFFPSAAKSELFSVNEYNFLSSSTKYPSSVLSTAFAFTDSLVDDNSVVYETAGSLKNGKTIWLLAKMPSSKILDDEINNYICFTNSHDGSGAVTAFMTNTRVVCNNTLNLALRNASRKWTTRHVGDINGKLQEARMSLKLAQRYTEELDAEANRLALVKVSRTNVDMLLDELFPINREASKRAQENAVMMREQFVKCMQADDLANFRNTAWGVVNAAADFADHATPMRMTKTYGENNWFKVLNGHPVLDTTYSIMKKVA